MLFCKKPIVFFAICKKRSTFAPAYGLCRTTMGADEPEKQLLTIY